MNCDDLDKARAEIARLNDQAEKNAAAHRADRARLDEALAAESRAWATVHAMRHDLARFNDDAREWGAELGKAMRERDEARAEVERLKESVANLDVLYVSRTDALRESEAEVERLRGIVEVNDRRLAAVWDEARAEVERLKANNQPDQVTE